MTEWPDDQEVNQNRMMYWSNRVRGAQGRDEAGHFTPREVHAERISGNDGTDWKWSFVTGSLIRIEEGVEKIKVGIDLLQIGIQTIAGLLGKQLQLQKDTKEDAELRRLEKKPEGFGGQDIDKGGQAGFATGLGDALVAAALGAILGALPQVMEKLREKGVLERDEIGLGKELAGGLVKKIVAIEHGIAGLFKKVGGMFGVGEGAAKVGEEAGEKGLETAAKAGGKSLLKGIFKVIPVIGALFSFYSAVTRVKEGDYFGALLDVATGLLDLTGIGSVVGIGLQAMNVIRDATDGGPDMGINAWIGDSAKKAWEGMQQLPLIGGLINMVQALDAFRKGDFGLGVKLLMATLPKMMIGTNILAPMADDDVTQSMKDGLRKFMEEHKDVVHIMKFAASLGLASTGDLYDAGKMMLGTDENFVKTVLGGLDLVHDIERAGSSPWNKDTRGEDVDHLQSDVYNSGRPIKGKQTRLELTTLKTASGKTYQVDKKYAENFSGFVSELEKTGYEIDSIGGYSDRNIAGTNTPSYHSLGAAIDINPTKNPVGPSNRNNLPKDIAAIAARHGLGWGGNWKSKKDPMHFSIASSEGGDVHLDHYGSTDGGVETDKGVQHVEYAGMLPKFPLHHTPKETPAPKEDAKPETPQVYVINHNPPKATPQSPKDKTMAGYGLDWVPNPSDNRGVNDYYLYWDAVHPDAAPVAGQL